MEPFSVLMQWAEGGSLDDFIDVRQGRAHQFPQARADPSTPTSGTNQAEENTAPYSRGARIRAFRALQHAPPEERERLRKEMERRELRPNSRDHQDWKAVHLLSAEEVKSLFKDVVEGLAFLVGIVNLCPGTTQIMLTEIKYIAR
ncbi:hypothetical protein PHLCEN_2v12697 [Hermanssonia centrifuga]|uniref:Uncharacterized protein n=1 Tax=Hermanssonia centrifuga TaxID=98765 RepID=A0A2R6NGC0_9APHY|nr:hypothetical protein PHLCEN_2v12697 [Hermanssonia centrifuga]